MAAKGQVLIGFWGVIRCFCGRCGLARTPLRLAPGKIGFERRGEALRPIGGFGGFLGHLRLISAMSPGCQGATCDDSLIAAGQCGTSPPASRIASRRTGEPLLVRCGSSVVEHPLGKGEVESSILSRSTIKPPYLQLFFESAVLPSAIGICWGSSRGSRTCQGASRV